MGFLFKNNDFRTDYKKRPFDGYKSVVDKLDEETKRKLDHQRTIGMMVIVAFVVLLVVILAVTGIGVDKTKSVSGNVFADKETVLIECFGDSLTEGILAGEGTAAAEVTYPEELKEMLPRLIQEDDRQYRFRTLEVKNYGQAGSVLQENSSSRLSGQADIVLILYTANNFVQGTSYENVLETNIGAIRKQGAQVFLLNYPIEAGSEWEAKIEQANHYIASVAESQEVPLIDLETYFATLTEEEQEDLFGADGLHLTAEGYRIMGDQTAEFLHEYYYEMN
ncbi:MAG: SGNH/GDSL hydrolase family protein [Parasporobacterium sp.]|nr:SGNH/GDSL hydrolase family protein [Parasporobacterium sp.]